MSLSVRAAVAFLSLVACSRSASNATTLRAPVVAASSATTSTVPATPPAVVLPATTWPSSLPRPALATPGPIKVVGYPTDIVTCLPDPAEHAGFTKDGSELGYCMHGMSTACELIDANGHSRTMNSRVGDDSPATDPAKEKQLAVMMKEIGLPALTSGDCVLHPAKLEGTWAYPDIVVNVASIAASWKKDGSSNDVKLVSQPLVRLGGAVAGEAPVNPITFAPPHHPLSPPATGEIPFNTIELNVLALSADGSELGIVVHAYCMEWCDEFQVVRLPVARFASLVYNDTGFRALAKGDLDHAADLFLRAAFVDPSRELPAYNLACTYARKGDAKAEAALELAIARGGDAVRVRASKDKDFDAVRAAPWFVKIVKP